jgi:hypothetical protein
MVSLQAFQVGIWSFISHLLHASPISMLYLNKKEVHPCTGTEALYRPGVAHRGSRGIALLFLDHGTRRG